MLDLILGWNKTVPVWLNDDAYTIIPSSLKEYIHNVCIVGKDIPSSILFHRNGYQARFGLGYHYNHLKADIRRIFELSPVCFTTYDEAQNSNNPMKYMLFFSKCAREAPWADLKITKDIISVVRSLDYHTIIGVFKLILNQYRVPYVTDIIPQVIQLIGFPLLFEQMRSVNSTD